MPLIPSALEKGADSTEQMSDRRTTVQDLRLIDGKHHRHVNVDGYRYPKSTTSMPSATQDQSKKADTNRRIVTRPMPRAPSSTSACGPARSTPAAEIRLHFLSRLGRHLREPRDSTAPTVSADAACTGHMVYARNAPWPKMWAIAPGPDSRNCSRCQGVVMFFASSSTTSNVALRIPAGCDLHVSRRIGTRPSLQWRSLAMSDWIPPMLPDAARCGIRFLCSFLS